MNRRQLVTLLSAAVGAVALLNLVAVALALLGLEVLAVLLLLGELAVAAVVLLDLRRGAPLVRRLRGPSGRAVRRLRGSRTRITHRLTTAGRVGKDRSAGRLRTSGLFDEAWYRQQLGEQSAEVPDAVEHYLSSGWRRGLSAHAAFDTDYYASQFPAGTFRTSAPILHYLTSRSRRLPHPGFPQPAYLKANPGSATHPGGPLGHFLEGLGRPAGVTGFLDDPRWFTEHAQAAHRLLESTQGTGHLPRNSPHHDMAAEAAFKAEVRARWAPEDRPLVSIVIPTLNRAQELPASLDSVLAQTYDHWELLVVDDGSTDDTPELLARYAEDPRVHVLRHQTPQGVARARNDGLAQARGDLIAYLDSDNTWVPDFLETMVAFMSVEGHRAAYAMSALEEEGGKQRRLFRGMPFDREALEEQNYIDCICLVHERTLLDEVGGYDETLRRNVDWDLLIRLSRRCDFGFAPFIASRYDVWDDRTGRITTDVPRGYRFRVRQRTLVEWPDPQALPEPACSVTLVAVVPPSGCDLDQVRALAEEMGEDSELVLVERHAERSVSLAAQLLAAALPRTRYVRLTQPLTDELARNVGASHARGRNLVFVALEVWRDPSWLPPLVAALDEHPVVQPLHQDLLGTVLCAGLDAPVRPGGEPLPLYARFSGTAPEVRGVRSVWGAAALVIGVRRADFVAVQGFDPLTLDDMSSEDLSRRIVLASGQPAACVGESVIAYRPKPSRSKGAEEEARAAATQQRLDREPLLEPGAASGATSGYVGDGYRLLGVTLQDTGVRAPVLVHERPNRPLRWAIKIGAPTVQRRLHWGDWHFALALQASLERLGQEVSVDCRGDWFRPSAVLDDVVLVLRGTKEVPVVPTQLNVVWVISHPEDVSPGELQQFDLAFAASTRWSAQASRRSGRVVEPLLQCTDHRRFHPRPARAELAHPIVNVSNARGLRRSVKAVLDAGLVPAVYGQRWEDLLPEGAWKAPLVPNEELPVLYSSAGVVLNDHWDDMREDGFVSNRLFDLAATESRVLSDHMPEIPELFGGAVATFQDHTDIKAEVDRLLADSDEDRATRAQVGRWVREHHSFDARAATLVERVTALHQRADGRVVALP